MFQFTQSIPAQATMESIVRRNHILFQSQVDIKGE
jgi:hypothetical protein